MTNNQAKPVPELTPCETSDESPALLSVRGQTALWTSLVRPTWQRAAHVFDVGIGERSIRITFGEEGHGLARRENQLRVHERTTEFLERNLLRR